MGRLGGMRNETDHWPEVCTKSLQAMTADLRGKIESRFFETYSMKGLQRKGYAALTIDH
jgi:hypothetical protein